MLSLFLWRWKAATAERTTTLHTSGTLVLQHLHALLRSCVQPPLA
jgi:hypothetical protein